MTKFENLTEDLDLGDTPQEIDQIKTLPYKIFLTLPVCYLQFFVLNIIDIQNIDLDGKNNSSLNVRMLETIKE